MRLDEEGNECPGTLGEYLDLVSAIAPNSAAVEMLENKIAVNPKGRDDLVLAADSQMRLLLYPLMAKPRS
ncbi:MAG: hypothetical protein E4G74_03715 [Erysipelotrichales bacterium]|nr:MAG: hypothetical protein E4G74_03715 [Erysipelotrichales bacterium]